MSLLITNLVGISVQFDTGVNMIINSFAIPAELGRQYLIPIIFVVTAVLEYFVFKTIILKLNIPTLGRERVDEEAEKVVDVNKVDSESGFTAQTKNIVEGLGGADNVTNIINCYTRLRVDVKDENKVNINMLKENVKASGIVDKGKYIQIVIGMGVEQERERVEAYIEYLKKEKK